MTNVVIILIFIFSSFGLDDPFQAEGIATYYADHFKGKQTASGERYDPQQFTAAHPFLPFNTYILVTNIGNGKTVRVRINDRMKASKTVIIDLSRAAAAQIDLLQKGTAHVELKEVEKDAPSQPFLPVEEGDTLVLPSPLPK
jgi:rare lipoprotein A